MTEPYRCFYCRKELLANESHIRAGILHEFREGEIRRRVRLFHTLSFEAFRVNRVANPDSSGHKHTILWSKLGKPSADTSEPDVRGIESTENE